MGLTPPPLPAPLPALGPDFAAWEFSARLVMFRWGNFFARSGLEGALLVTLTPCGKFLGIAEPEGFERVTPELLNFCIVELIELGPEEEVDVDEAGTATGVTVAPGNLVTVVDFNWGRPADAGETFPAIVAPDGCTDLALKPTVFWGP